MNSFSNYPEHFEVSQSQLQNVIKGKFGGNLMYFSSYFTDVLTMTNILHHPQTSNSAKL